MKKVLIVGIFNFFVQVKFHAQLSGLNILGCEVFSCRQQRLGADCAGAHIRLYIFSLCDSNNGFRLIDCFGV